MDIVPWVDTGACLPTFRSTKDALCCVPLLFWVDISCLCNTQHWLPTSQFSFASCYLLTIIYRVNSRENCEHCCHQMSDFKAKIHQIQFRLELRSKCHCGNLQCSPEPLAGFKGSTSKGREEGRKGGEAKGRMELGGNSIRPRSAPTLYLLFYAPEPDKLYTAPSEAFV